MLEHALKLIANGYTVIPAHNKRTNFKGWSELSPGELNKKAIETLKNDSAGYYDGLAIRLKGTHLIDIDIDCHDDNLTKMFIKKLLILAGIPFSRSVALRGSKGYKFIFRIDNADYEAYNCDDFYKINTDRYLLNNYNEMVEIRNRQTMVYGVNNKEKNIYYRFMSNSLFNTPVSDLPIIDLACVLVFRNQCDLILHNMSNNFMLNNPNVILNHFLLNL